jgi:hypothetical protein
MPSLHRYRALILAALPRARARHAAWLANERVRAGVTAAVVVLVPGAWAVWLVWQAVRRVRGAASADA